MLKTPLSLIVTTILGILGALFLFIGYGIGLHYHPDPTALDKTLLSPEQYSATDTGIKIKETPDNFMLEIVTQLQPHLNTELSGLYQSSGNFCTQCEAEGFRRITYFLD